jgi:hypothetical protein
LLRRGPGACAVHGLEITSVKATTGEQLSHHSCSTQQRLRADNVSQGAQAGRERWQVANENHNVLTTTGDHIEHHLGQGKNYLAAFRLSLNLLAVLCHTVLQGCDDK